MYIQGAKNCVFYENSSGAVFGFWRRRRRHSRAKSGAAEGVKTIEEKSLLPQKAGESLKRQETRLGAAEGSTNVDKSLTPPKTVKHC